MQAVILAAGRGTRLGAKADGLPKCLLQVGGRPLLDHQLRTLAEVGVSPVLVVVGYAADLVREALGNRAETILNARYAATNSLYSLWLAREWIKGPVLVANSDILCAREAYEMLARAGPDHLAYDSSSGKAAEHMKVRFEDGRLREMSKALDARQSNGENVGMVHLGARTAELVLAKADQIVSSGRESAFWAEALRAAAEEVPIRGVDIAGVPWVEIDTPYDLERARREVWPALEDRTGPLLARRRRRWRLAVAAGVLALLGAMAGVWFLARGYGTPSWEPVDAQAAKPVTVRVGGLNQEWWEARGGETIATRISGPRTVRVDVRCLIARDVKEGVPYVVEASIDGQRLDWFKFMAKPDPLAGHPDAVVCDRDKIEVAVPEGEHEVGVRLMAGDVAGLLARFRVREHD